MIDYLMKFTDEAEAKADPVVGAFNVEDAWRGDVCLPGCIVRHLPSDALLPYWYVTISADQDEPALREHPACVLVADWDGMTVSSAVIPEGELADYQVSPVFAGRDPAALLAVV